ncbi:hypothetical protein M438DRAFT_309568 [Aureobasidium pullulans EXF-150]|uniref:Uncharacterized protein n=1 Tax=Aureobasidium pullulans EXF-150 TaxID=1043002 RepID=A0A074Y1K5_AURPU|nr:uncharacterized protein M438DRAFT_309568 [Aureobasidium pullulans EXF-150]KEQ89819.1 hypothetical protein M438DRAFT_309568 [Aureobasidium pullulans EXF-150]
MALFALCCTADIPSEKLNKFLHETYRNSSKMDCQPSLFLISSLNDLNASQELIASQTPVQPFSSPFLGQSAEDTAKLLQSHINKLPTSNLHPTLLVILDEESIFSDSGLIVQIKNSVVHSVRVHFDTINAELIRIMMITFDIKETQGLVGENGVFRTKPPDESKKGRPAPRKKLG